MVSPSTNPPTVLWRNHSAAYRKRRVVSLYTLLPVSVYLSFPSLFPPRLRPRRRRQNLRGDSPSDRLRQLPHIDTQQHTAAIMDLRVGGKYRIGKKIGSGSFGESCTLLCPTLLRCAAGCGWTGVGGGRSPLLGVVPPARTAQRRKGRVDPDSQWNQQAALFGEHSAASAHLTHVQDLC